MTMFVIGFLIWAALVLLAMALVIGATNHDDN